MLGGAGAILIGRHLHTVVFSLPEHTRCCPGGQPSETQPPGVAATARPGIVGTITKSAATAVQRAFMLPPCKGERNVATNDRRILLGKASAMFCLLAIARCLPVSNRRYLIGRFIPSAHKTRSPPVSYRRASSGNSPRVSAWRASRTGGRRSRSAAPPARCRSATPPAPAPCRRRSSGWGCCAWRRRPSACGSPARGAGRSP